MSSGRLHAGPQAGSHGYVSSPRLSEPGVPLAGTVDALTTATAPEADGKPVGQTPSAQRETGGRASPRPGWSEVELPASAAPRVPGPHRRYAGTYDLVSRRPCRAHHDSERLSCRQAAGVGRGRPPRAPTPPAAPANDCDTSTSSVPFRVTVRSGKVPVPVSARLGLAGGSRYSDTARPLALSSTAASAGPVTPDSPAGPCCRSRRFMDFFAKQIANKEAYVDRSRSARRPSVGPDPCSPYGHARPSGVSDRQLRMAAGSPTTWPVPEPHRLDRRPRPIAARRATAPP